MTDYFEDIGMLGRGERLRAAYLLGFALSLILTFAAYALVTQHVLAGALAIAVLLALALAQFTVQLIFFLHISRELSSRMRVATLCCAVAIVAILVSGSIWIMNHLSGRMMDSQAMEQYMQQQPGI